MVGKRIVNYCNKLVGYYFRSPADHQEEELPEGQCEVGHSHLVISLVMINTVF